MAGLTLTWEGLGEFEARLRAIASSSEPTRSLAALLFQRANAILGVSQRLVPVDLGVLRSSGHVPPPKVTRTGAEAEIVYGGPAREYATFVHEDLSAFHNPPTQAKYLEQPFLAERDNTIDELSDYVRNLIAATSVGRAFGGRAASSLTQSRRGSQAVGRALRSLGRSAGVQA